MSTTAAPSSSPCLLDEQDSRIDPGYVGLGKESTMQITAGNTIIYCNMWPEMVAYYRDQLGLQPTFEKDAWFIELQLCEGCHLSLAAAERCSVPSAHGKGLTLSWKVAELAALHASLVAKGIETSDITSHSWRAPYFYIHDPEGNRIELWSENV
jgi:catechol-2,3-dioxygenase